MAEWPTETSRWLILSFLPLYGLTYLWRALKLGWLVVLTAACGTWLIYCWVAGYRVYQGANLRLAYRICGSMNHDDQNRLAKFVLEIEPRNKNSETVHYVVSDHFLRLDGRASTDRFEEKSIDLVPAERLIPGAAIPVQKDHVYFDPPIKSPPVLKGEYRYVVRFGRDADHPTRTSVITGRVSILFGPDGQPLGPPRFTPSGDSGVEYDSTDCEVTDE
ncbi:MAG: hypothetical protein JO335_03770 [Sphingomonas sp.]|nr:hypothetical protein [Sphingomonas sp.]